MKKIAVLMSNPVQYYSIQPLLEALDVVSIGYDIVIPNWDASTFQKEGWDAMEKDLESMLVKKGILFIKANETNDYSVSLTPYPEWWDVKADFKVRYRYSYVSFPAFSTAPENNMQYDVILSYGEPDAEYFSAYARTCIVGEPKLLSYNKDSTIHAKPVLLYLPTCGGISAIQQTVPQLKKLVQEYEIIVKAHHGTSFLEVEEDRREMLKNVFTTVYDAKTPLYDLLGKADVVLSDNSGAIFDALAAGVPVARFALVDPDTVEGFVPQHVELAKKGVLPSTDDSNRIGTVLKLAMTDKIRKAQAEVAKELFANAEDGKKHFVELMTELLNASEKKRFFSLQLEKRRYNELQKNKLQNFELLEGDFKEVQRLLAEKQKYCCQLLEEKEKLQNSVDDYELQIEKQHEKLNAIHVLLQNQEGQLNTANHQLQKQQTHTEKIISLAEKTFGIYAAEQQQMNEFVTQGREYCELMLNSRFFKLLHFWSRIKKQLVLGSITEKIHFMRWLLHRPDEMADRRFQPLNSVYHTLQAALAVPSIQPFSFEERLAKEKQLEEAGVLKTIGFLESAFLEYIRNDRARFSAIADQFCETNVSREIVRRIRTVPAKGVLVSPCVEDRRAIDDAYFLLDKMAKAGWLCLLASNDVTCVQQVSERLLLVPQTELLRALQIEPVVLLLGWAGNVAFADAVPEKKIWYHLSDYSNRSTLYDTVYEQVHAALLERATFVTYGDKKLLSQLENRADATEVSASTSGDTLGKLLSSNGAVKLPAFYQKHDVIILSVIDYDFRFQRPQHFAVRFAENGHRVFYINANFHRPASVHKQSENLYVVDFFNSDAPAIYGTDWSEKTESIQAALKELLWKYGIRDAITIVDYPNWVNAAVYLREEFGFKMVVDYMDDYTGFLTPAEKNVGENCVKLLQTCDLVIPSSQFLADISAKYFAGPIGIVRNGTEYDHFHEAFGTNPKKERKIVGYYGAVAHWFDAEKIVYLAKHLPECDFVIVGAVTEWEEVLQSQSNIKLLGEQPYSELPSYLKMFDVCLIPFDTSTDLIKATNPVKFYEYLSAGKKVVATEIPELMPFRDRYVYMANDDETFLQYVTACLDGTDTLAGPEECAVFAQENDWQHRYEAFADMMRTAVPKISVIVLTYNNLKLNKLCTETLLSKTAYPNYELILVDNASVDGTRDWLKELDAQNVENVTVILNEDNLGFAGGNNVGIQAASGDYIVLLNNDTVPTRGWLTAMAKHLQNDSHLGMCGPVTNSIGNEAKVAVEYHDLDGLEQFAYRYTWVHNGQEMRNVKALALFCTMIRKSVIQQCGMLDDGYRVGMFEDDDYSEAVRAAGWGMAIVDDAFVHHQDGATFKKLDKKKYETVFKVNLKRFEEKWNKKWEMHSYRPGMTTEQNKDCLLEI